MEGKSFIIIGVNNILKKIFPTSKTCYFCGRKKECTLDRFLKPLILLAVAVFGWSNFMAYAEGGHPSHSHESETSPEEKLEKEFDAAAFILHHIADDYQFHVIKDIYIPLPVIIFEPGQGFDVFLSSEFHHVDDSHLSRGKYYYHHGKLTIAGKDEHGHPQTDSTGAIAGKHQAKITDIFGDQSKIFYNLSITKNVFGILLSCALMLLIFTASARAYRKRPNQAPRGLQGFMEPLILFVQNDIARPSIGEKRYRTFLPYLLTLFFFIWINNLLGLIPIFPGSANVTGNIAVTMTLALLSLLMVFIFGRKHFWSHTLWPHGMPVPIKIIVGAIEFVGVFTKPFSLMIRLFANITAGHIIIMSIIGITFTIQSYAVGVVTSLFSVAMFMLELLVAAIQAYIFTLLTALMIGAAVEEPHHAEHGHGH